MDYDPQIIVAEVYEESGIKNLSGKDENHYLRLLRKEINCNVSLDVIFRLNWGGHWDRSDLRYAFSKEDGGLFFSPSIKVISNTHKKKFNKYMKAVYNTKEIVLSENVLMELPLDKDFFGRNSEERAGYSSNMEGPFEGVLLTEKIDNIINTFNQICASVQLGKYTTKDFHKLYYKSVNSYTHFNEHIDAYWATTYMDKLKFSNYTKVYEFLDDRELEFWRSVAP